MCSFEKSLKNHSLTRCHISRLRGLQIHRCENLKVPFESSFTHLIPIYLQFLLTLSVTRIVSDIGFSEWWTGSMKGKVRGLLGNILFRQVLVGPVGGHEMSVKAMRFPVGTNSTATFPLVSVSKRPCFSPKFYSPLCAPTSISLLSVFSSYCKVTSFLTSGTNRRPKFQKEHRNLCWRNELYSAVHGFWPVEFSNGRLGATHYYSDSVVFGLVLLSACWPCHAEVPVK